MTIDSVARTKEIVVFPRPACLWSGEGFSPRIILPGIGDTIMRCRIVALCSVVLSVLAAFFMTANAEEAKNDVKGLFLLADYPAVTLRPGTTSTINLRLQNLALPPERLTLSIAGVPS